MGAKTSIAESVESLFLFYENSESEHIKVIFNVLGFVFVLFQRNVKGFASKQMEGKSLLCLVSTGHVFHPDPVKGSER